MISKNQIKIINSFQQKKYRKIHQQFFAEGRKVIQELLHSNFELIELFTTQESFPKVSKNQINTISDAELRKISALVTPNESLAVFKIPKELEKISETGLTIVLDDIRDPGNMGTIIRLADWFGVSQVVCSLETVDVYNPKVVQSTMGSLARVSVVYLDLKEYLKSVSKPIYGTLLEGENIYSEELNPNSVLILGNESNGISKDIQECITQKITIPRFGSLQETESLNVATAAAIVLSEFCRNN